MSTARAAAVTQCRILHTELVKRCDESDNGSGGDCDCDHGASSSSAVLQLGPMDHLLAFFITTGVMFVYRYDEQRFGRPADEFMSLTLLRRAIQQLLRLYPQLSGRARWNEADQTPQIHQLHSGAQLLQVTHPATLTELFASTGTAHADSADAVLTARSFPDGGASLLPPKPDSPAAACQNPLMSVQHTRFSCGSVCIGVRIHHWVCDGEGFFQIVRDLAQLYRALRQREAGSGAEEEPPLTSPHNDSYMAGLADSMTAEERAAALAHRPEHYVAHSADNGVSSKVEEEKDAAAPAVADGPMQSRVVHFSGRDLSSLKTLATPRDGGWVSTFEALAAHVHQSVYRARLAHERLAWPGRDLSQRKEDLQVSINCRPPNRLNLAPRYTPNAVINVALNLSAHQLAHSSLADVASALHCTMHSMSPDQVERDLRWVAAQLDKTAVANCVRFEHTMVLTQWSKLHIYRGLSFERVQPAKAAMGQAQGRVRAGVPLNPVLVAPAFDSSVLYPRLVIFMEPCPAAQRMDENEDRDRAQEQEGASDTAAAAVTATPAPAKEQGIDVYLALPQAVWAHLDSDQRFKHFA